jgi:hypothetical protein
MIRKGGSEWPLALKSGGTSESRCCGRRIRIRRGVKKECYNGKEREEGREVQKVKVKVVD